MASPLLSSLAATINSAASFSFLDATLERDTPGVSSDPADPVAPTTETYSCKAIEDQFSTGLLAAGLVNSLDINILILANSFKNNAGARVLLVPKSLDRITIRGNLVTVVPADSGGRKAVASDPARATWSCRCRQ